VNDHWQGLYNVLCADWKFKMGDTAGHWIAHDTMGEVYHTFFRNYDLDWIQDVREW